MTYPLQTNGSNTLLRDADPAIFYALEFYKQCIETHVGDRLLQEASEAGADMIAAAVAETLPLNPEPFLTEEHIKFPLLAVYRKSSTFRYVGQRKLSVDEMDIAYVLPPMEAGEAERLLPILKAVMAVIDSRTEQGFDPAYTPTTPTGTAGEVVWKADRAGLARVEVTGVSYGGYTPTPDLYFPAVVLSAKYEERHDYVMSELQVTTGVDATLDLKDPTDGTTVSDVVQAATQPAPTLVSLSPGTGSKAGGTPVTLTGTGFRVGTRPRVIFAGSDASNVTVVDATTITCVTPAHAAYPTFAADVYVIAADGQLSNTLTTGFTFTSP